MLNDQSRYRTRGRVTALLSRRTGLALVWMQLITPELSAAGQAHGFEMLPGGPFNVANIPNDPTHLDVEDALEQALRRRTLRCPSATERQVHAVSGRLFCVGARGRHGPFERWNRFGELTTRGQYRFGRAHGGWTVFYGETAFTRMTYRSGVLHGPWATVEGQVVQESGHYRRGRRHGRWWRRYERSSRAGSETSSHTTAIFMDGLRHGPWTERFDDTVSTVHFLRDVPHGRVVFEYRDGFTMFRTTGRLDLGRQHGRWTHTAHVGGVELCRAQGEFHFGEPTGRWELSHGTWRSRVTPGERESAGGCETDFPYAALPQDAWHDLPRDPGA